MNRPALALSSGAKSRRFCPLYVTAAHLHLSAGLASRQPDRLQRALNGCACGRLLFCIRGMCAYLIRLLLRNLDAQQDTLRALTFRIHSSP